MPTPESGFSWQLHRLFARTGGPRRFDSRCRAQQANLQLRV